MSFLSGIIEAGKAVVGFVSGNSIASSLLKTVALGYAMNRLSQNATLPNNTDTTETANIDAGVRLQIPPAASNKIPVLYGTAFFGGIITDAAMTNNNKTMWYAVTLTEKTGTKLSDNQASTYVFKDIYWNDQRIVFNTDGITVSHTVDRNGNIDRSLANLVKVYCYAGNSTSGVIPENYTGTVPAANTLMPNWGANHTMSNLIFALVRVDYNRDKGVLGIGNMMFHVANSMYLPGDVLYDYMPNNMYGAGISVAEINTTQLAALNTYSAESVAYDDQETGAQTLADRYQINGLLDTKNTVMSNIERICNACASWLSYDSHEGKWGVVINKAGTSVASFNDSNILGNIDLSGVGLTELYNIAEVQFPHRDLRDSADFVNIELGAEFRNDNEEDNPYNITYDIINEPIQAQLLGFIELKQSRIDQIIQFQTDFSFINLKAGDVIDVSDTRFGFNKVLYRIITITEVQEEDGALKMDITAQKYDADVYVVSNADLYRYTRTDANGIITIGSIGQPGTPQVSKIERDSRPRVIIESTAPTGVVEGLEYWISTDTTEPNDENRTYVLIATKRPEGGGVFASGTPVVLEYDSLSATNFVVKTRGFNTTTVGPYSEVSGAVEYNPVQTTDAITPETQAFDATGGMLTALGVSTLLSLLGGLFGSDASKSLFDKVFETFKDVTGVDLVGQASSGDLVVASDLEIKSSGTSLGPKTASMDFKGPLAATGSTNITVKIKDGTKNKQILAWNSSDKEWQLISDCIACEFENIPPAVGPEVPCSLQKIKTLPSNNFQAVNDICPTETTVPYVGSYFIKFGINSGSSGANPAAPSSMVAGTEYTIAQAGNTDWTWWGAPESATTGIKFKAKLPSTTFPNGKTVKEIIVGKKYAIKTVGSMTKAEWNAIGWEGSTSTSNPTVGDQFVATAKGTKDGLVTFTNGNGWIYGSGESKPAINLVAPLIKGTGSFKLYGTDGQLEQSVPIASCTIWNDVVEIPFTQRAPGKDYYVIWEEGIVTNCSCENSEANSADIWTFTTSEIPREPYLLKDIGPSTIPDGQSSSDVFNRSQFEYTYTPSATICSTSQTLKLIVSPSAIGGLNLLKGTGSATLKNRETGATIKEFLAGSATITEIKEDVNGVQTTTKWEVDCGSIPELEADKYYDFVVPRGFIVTESKVGETVYCDKTTKTPAPPSRQCAEKTWGVKIGTALKVEKVEYCQTDTGNAKLRTNIKITFNKPVRTKDTGPAEIGIYGGTFGTLFQKIDLLGTYANKKYGTIYDGATSSKNDPDTANNETVGDYVVMVNPTMMFKPNSEYHIKIPAGVIIDSTCDAPWEGVNDSTTIAWKTDGAVPTAPEEVTYGSVLFDFEFDRPILPGYAKMNIITPSGMLLTQIPATDLAVQIKYNERFND